MDSTSPEAMNPRHAADEHSVRAPLPPERVRPHVVILGAGASRAACPGGDRDGRPLPVMRDIVRLLGLRDILLKAGIEDPDANFEAAYSQLWNSGGHSDLVRELELRVEEYFRGLRLPDRPTVYDHLVLSMRPKDTIASFNWDPLLFQAVLRNQDFAPMPHIVFLHGNVALGACCRHVPASVGHRLSLCPKCGESYQPLRLLYPVTRKNYQVPPVSHAWHDLQGAMRNAFVLTVFGYSAPTSDVEAVELMTKGWGDRATRQFEQTEIIDIAPRATLLENWRQFYFSGHYQVLKSFSKSSLAWFPRRSIEHMLSQYIDAKWQLVDPLPVRMGWNNLYKWLEPRVQAERESEESGPQPESQRNPSEAGVADVPG